MFSIFSSKDTDNSSNTKQIIYFVKNRDTRCSTKCIQIWTRYNQIPPIGHYCSCVKP